MGVDCASVLEHTYRVMWLALIIARLEKTQVDENKIIKMAFVHDLPETRTSDLNYVAKGYVTPNEQLAADDLFKQTIVEDYKDIWEEYEKRECLEAKIVRDADNLDLDFEQKELEERGHKLPGKWKEHTRRTIRNDSLYTETAKKIWDELQECDPQSWHMNSHKYLKNPNAGK